MRLDNPVKDALRNGEVVLGVFIPPPSPDMVEICALAGFDFVLLDAEHGPISPESAYPMILAAEAHGIPAIARIGQSDRQVILKFLDIGIAGVMVPQVTTGAAAEAAIAAMKYQPRGNRGLAGGRTFNYGLGDLAKDLVPRINDRVLSIIQFEHVDAFDELEAILQIEDLDVLFVGPNDLAQSMGYPGQPTHPEVQRRVDEVVALAKPSGVALGTVAADAATAQGQIERGFRMIVANAPTLLARAGQEFITGVRR